MNSLSIMSRQTEGGVYGESVSPPFSPCLIWIFLVHPMGRSHTGSSRFFSEVVELVYCGRR